MRSSFSLVFITCTLLVTSCKRDLLELDRAWRMDGGTNNRLNNIAFINDSICIAAGGSTFYQSTIIRSTDGGYTWKADSSSDAPKEMYGMGISPWGAVYLSGIDGDVLVSKDKGTTWQFHRIDNWLVYKGGAFATPDTGIFVSSVLQRECTITRVDSTFKILDEQTFKFGLNNIYFTDANTAYVLGYGAIMKTIDRGNNWSFLDIDGDNFTSMSIIGNEFWVCGAAGSIFHSTDAGAHWERFRNGNDITRRRYMLRSILFTTTQQGWAVGDDGLVIFSQDGGRNWMEYTAFTTNHLRSIALCPDGDLVIAGTNGGLYRIKQ